MTELEPRVDRLRVITESTFIPISLVVLLFGGVVWLTNLNAKASSNTRAIEEVKQKQDGDSKNIQAIKESVIRIEEQLNPKMRGISR